MRSELLSRLERWLVLGTNAGKFPAFVYEQSFDVHTVC